jgi:hypothetical protein
MSYDAAKELARVKKFYDGDPLQSRFSALICGGVGSGKTYLLRTCRFPVHIDSFDPGGTKCLKPWIDKGLIVADTSFEHEDPFSPSVWTKWTKVTEIRLHIGYYEQFGTYVIDSSTKFQDAAMNFIMVGAKGGSRAGEAPQMRHDYTPTKVLMQNYFTKFMNLPCDFILTGHLKEEEQLLSVDKSTGVETKKTEYRYMTIGQAAVTIPLMFDEIYVLQVNGHNRTLLLDAQGQFIARSRLKSNGKLDNEEPADIKALLKKIGLSWEDKPRLVFPEPQLTEQEKSV